MRYESIKAERRRNDDEERATISVKDRVRQCDARRKIDGSMGPSLTLFYGGAGWPALFSYKQRKNPCGGVQLARKIKNDPKDAKKTGRNGPESPGRGWFTRSEMAAMFGVSDQQFDRKYRPLIPDHETRAIGKWIFIRGRAALEMFAADSQRKTKPDQGDVTPMAPQTADRIMEEKLRLLEIERQARERQLLPREEAHVSLSRLAAILRGLGEILGREYGAGAQGLMEEALNDFEREVEHGFGA